MEQLAETNPNGLVAHTLGIDLTNLTPVFGDESEHINPIKIANMVRTRHKQSLIDERVGKIIHGTFARETGRPECDKVPTHAWRRNGR